MRILFIDDDQKISSLINRILTFEGHEVYLSSNGEQGLLEAKRVKPDLVILDIMMPGMSGWEVCRKLRVNSDVPILMLTARDEVADRVRGLDAGADDYLVKPFALEELLARVRALLRRAGRNKPKGDRVYTFLDVVLDIDKREAKRGENIIPLTAREFDLLKMFMEHPRHVLTKNSLMEQIWGHDFSGESNVLEVSIGNLRNKLEHSGKSRIIQTVRGVGYTMRE